MTSLLPTGGGDSHWSRMRITVKNLNERHELEYTQNTINFLYHICLYQPQPPAPRKER